jgi:hypothetical protein
MSMQSFQHLAPLMMDKDFMSKDSLVWYALDIRAESSFANCSPPRPSNCGVALAELKNKVLISVEKICLVYVLPVNKEI